MKKKNQQISFINMEKKDSKDKLKETYAKKEKKKK